MNISFDTIHELIGVLDESPGVTELSINGPNGTQISIKRNAGALQSLVVYSGRKESEQFESEDNAARFEDEELAELTEPPAYSAIASNRVGIFHAAKPPVGKNSIIANGQIVGYIESMKLMNEVRSESTGTVVETMIDDGIPVEYGQPLFRLTSAAA